MKCPGAFDSCATIQLAKKAKSGKEFFQVSVVLSVGSYSHIILYNFYFQIHYLCAMLSQLIRSLTAS